MLLPNRFSDLQLSLLNSTSLVVECLRKNDKATMAEVLEYLQVFHEGYNRDDVIRCITFLYALGKVIYSEKTDRVWLIKQKISKDSKVA